MPSESSLLLFVGLFTSLFGSVAAVLEVDVKRVIAFSTLSQLGIMFVRLGLGCRSLCFLHLNCHAIFKALLFLSVGVLIHSCYGSQESRALVLSPSSAVLPLTCIVVACLSMCGLVFLSGWATKDAIFDKMLNGSCGFLCTLLFFIGIGLTLVYSLGLILKCSCSSSTFVVSCTMVSSSFLFFIPFLNLLFFRVLEGHYLLSSSNIPSSPLSICEKFLLVPLFLASFFLTYFLFRFQKPNLNSIFAYSVFRTTITSCLPLLSIPNYLEASGIQGFVVPRVSFLLGLPITLGSLTSKVFIFLCLVIALG